MSDEQTAWMLQPEHVKRLIRECADNCNTCLTCKWLPDCMYYFQQERIQ